MKNTNLKEKIKEAIKVEILKKVEIFDDEKFLDSHTIIEFTGRSFCSFYMRYAIAPKLWPKEGTQRIVAAVEGWIPDTSAEPMDLRGVYHFEPW